MADVMHAEDNLLELSTTTVSLGANTEDIDFPLYRIFDRDIGLIFKPVAAITTDIMIDQGVSPIAVDRLFIGPGHNLTGMTLDILWSDDDISYTPIVTQFIGTAGLITKSWTPATHRYWMFKITSPGSIPEITEIFLTTTYTWAVNPSRPSGTINKIHNATNRMTAGGQDRFLIHGPSKARKDYSLNAIPSTQRTAMESLWDAWGGAKPFFMSDHEGIWLYGKIRGDIELREISSDSHRMNFNFMEVIG